jgi:hypothetical protein
VAPELAVRNEVSVTEVLPPITQETQEPGA